jgi:hypothetical protein
MKVVIGEEGLKETWQSPFPKTTKCDKCGGTCRIGFVTKEMKGEEEYVCRLHENKGIKDYWLHDSCAVAVYFCKDCLEVKAMYNQA